MAKVKLTRKQRYRAKKLGIDCKMVSELDLDRIKKYQAKRSGPKGNKFVTEMVKVGGLTYDKIKRRAGKLGIDKVSSREDVEKIMNYESVNVKDLMREVLQRQTIREMYRILSLLYADRIVSSVKREAPNE